MISERVLAGRAKAKSLGAVIGAHGGVLARQNEAEADGRMMAD
jgi:hypothetical protein